MSEKKFSDFLVDHPDHISENMYTSMNSSMNMSLNTSKMTPINTSTDSSPQNIKVVCRIRPLNEKEKEISEDITISVLHDQDRSLTFKNQIYRFDQIITPETTQLDVYETIAKPVLNDVLEGFNGTILAYGQTSSGKTFTMEGVLGDVELEGIIPRLSKDIFDHIELKKKSSTFTIKISNFQIYMERVHDLLDVTKTNLSIQEDVNQQMYIKDLSKREVSNAEEILQIFRQGQRNRIINATGMNEHSSRSHSIFQIEVKQIIAETEVVLNGKMFLIDLAGSETVSKTNAEGRKFKEACKINESLLQLGNVIIALVGKKLHIPYRNSKLTHILKESLGGNSLTTLIICCSPSLYNEFETGSTLKFGSLTKKIKNCVKINEELTVDKWKQKYDTAQALIRNLEQEIENLKSSKSKSGRFPLKKLHSEQFLTKDSSFLSTNGNTSNYTEVKTLKPKNHDKQLQINILDRENFEKMERVFENVYQLGKTIDLSISRPLCDDLGDKFEDYMDRLKFKASHLHERLNESLILSEEHEKANLNWSIVVDENKKQISQITADKMRLESIIENLNSEITDLKTKEKIISSEILHLQERIQKYEVVIENNHNQLVNAINFEKSKNQKKHKQMKNKYIEFENKIRVLVEENDDLSRTINKMTDDKYRYRTTFDGIHQKYIAKLNYIGNLATRVQTSMLYTNSNEYNMLQMIINSCNLNEIIKDPSTCII